MVVCVCILTVFVCILLSIALPVLANKLVHNPPPLYKTAVLALRGTLAAVTPYIFNHTWLLLERRSTNAAAEVVLILTAHARELRRQMATGNKHGEFHENNDDDAPQCSGFCGNRATDY